MQQFPHQASFPARIARHAVGLTALAAVLAMTVLTPNAQAATGSYLRPYADNSLWNSRPIDPVLGTYEIPTSTYYPSVAEGAWSSGVFLAQPTDTAVDVVAPVGAKGVWDPDAEAYRPSVTIPRWPGDVIPASAADGHADIVDETAGVVHSFWKLRNDNGVWRAAQYAWSPLNGRGWGDPAHYYQGARAAAVPTSAGIIRKHEIDDGADRYAHPLAMSLTYNALAAAPAYVFPATSADSNAATTNSGEIPEGTLLMLPPTFDGTQVTTPALKKIVETLKTFGGFVVDRNTGTPFVIYVENGSGFSLHKGGWNNTAAGELDLIRSQLRPVLSTAGWADANGVAFSPSKKMNLLSMRGAWGRLSGDGTAAFDTMQQAAVIPASASASQYRNVSNRNVAPPTWAKPAAGTTYKFTANATGGAKLRMDIVDAATNTVAFTTGFLADGASMTFAWPADSYRTVLYVTTVAGQDAVVSGKLVQP